MPLYEDLVSRAVAAKEEASRLGRDSGRVRALAQILRDAAGGRVSIRRCAWCERFDIGGEWLHLEAVGRGQQRIATSLLERATHGICDDCLEKHKRRAAERQAR